MKRIIIIALCAIGIGFAGKCNYWNDNFPILHAPHKTGTYTHITNQDVFSNGTVMAIGLGIYRDEWKDDSFYEYHSVSCSISNIEHVYQYEPDGGIETCYVITIDCSVTERTQFFRSNVKYTDLNGYRTDGTLKWSRLNYGSTDIICYDENGINVIKRVNDPYYCN